MEGIAAARRAELIKGASAVLAAGGAAEAAMVRTARNMAAHVISLAADLRTELVGAVPAGRS